MLSRIIRREPQDSEIWPARSARQRWWTKGTIAAALAAGALVGVAILMAGPVLVLAGILGIIVALAAFRYPEMLIVLMLALASQLIPSRFNFFVDLFVARFQVSDLLLFWLLFVTVLRVVMEKRYSFRSTPLDVPLVLFYAGVLGGLATAVIGFDVNFNNATYEARTLAYYLAFFPITNLVRTRAQLLRLGMGTIAVGVLMAASMLAQSAFQPAFLADDWMVEGGEIVRIFHPGFTAVYVALLMIAAYAAVRLSGTENRIPGWTWLRWPIMILLVAGLFSTLARNLVIASLVSFGLVALLLGRGERGNLVRQLLGLALGLGLLLGLVSLVADSPAGIGYGTAFLDRFERMFSGEILSQDENLVSRWDEMSFAMEKLQEHPILGIGLYSPYRPAFYREEPVTLRHFIHNAYLGIWLKAGLLGLISFFWLSAAFLRNGFRHWRRVTDPLLRGVTLGSLAAWVGLLATNLVAPSFIQPGSLAIMGVTLGLTSSILLLDGDANRKHLEGEVV